MPNLLLDSRSIFDANKILLSNWLKYNIKSVGVLNKDSLDLYSNLKFIAGWFVEIGHNDDQLSFHILIDTEFPYSPIRVAYKSQDVYRSWPHVEPENLFCLPKIASPYSGIEMAISETLRDALILIDNCKNPQYVESEFRNEFVSYWAHQVHSDKEKVISLLDVLNRKPRKIAAWNMKGQLLVGENTAQISAWLKNFGRSAEGIQSAAGIFCYMGEAPVPPYPDHPRFMLDFLKNSCPQVEMLLNEHPVENNLLVVLAADSSTGVGLISSEISTPSSLQGFRENRPMKLRFKRQLWSMRSTLLRKVVIRNDPSWIHGRGLDENFETLSRANVVFLGCGSLGSHVAVRLAQSGVSRITLVDPETLAAANVGRHVLGLDSVGDGKAASLARLLGYRFPHLAGIESYDKCWQVLYQESPDVFEQADLIVACIGEWSAEGQLGEWYSRAHPKSPILFGWLDEQGTASHALALDHNSPPLSCVLDANGRLRVPETLWRDQGKMRQEPACGDTFQPFGPVDTADAESLVSRLCIDIITNKSSFPVHRVHAGSTKQLKNVGGEWSPSHLSNRPKGFEGSFVYERPVEFCQTCTVCLESMN